MKTPTRKSRKNPLLIPSLSAAELGLAVGGSLPKESAKKLTDLPNEVRYKSIGSALPNEMKKKLINEQELK